MQIHLPLNKTKFKARALFVGERIDVRALENAERLAITPLMISTGVQGIAVILRYGVVVLFNLDPLEEVSFLNHIKPLVTEPFSKPEIEEAAISIEPGREETAGSFGLILSEPTGERLQLVAEILGKSVVLAHYEASVAEVFDLIEPLAVELQHKIKVGSKGKDLMRHIGRTLLIHHKMVGRVEVDEKPDLLWDHQELERLYLRLEDEYELKERHIALERKLELIFRTVETLNDLHHSTLTLRLEWYVVFLIVFEILLSLFEMFVHRK
ncbi:MAG: RMD1 family protein [Blastocatellia bacterium]|nr:RMD1 family protein [Blastocatellia bacterium]